MPRPDYTLPLDQLPDPLPIEPLTKPFDVTITPPGSKSITCRAYVLAALANGDSKLIRPLRADDTDLLLQALCTLGAEARWEGDDVHIKGVNGRFPRGGSVNLGDGGTPTRFMIACACLAAEPVVVDGSKRMRERPIAEGVEMLRQLGAKIEYVEAEGRLPVRVTPSEMFVGGEIEVGQTQSSQFISSLVLIAPWLQHGLRIVIESVPVSASYLQLTLNVCRVWSNPEALKFAPDEFNWRFVDGSIPAVVEVKPLKSSSATMTIERDASSAAYWFVAAAIVRQARLGINGLRWPPDQPDANVVGVLMHANLCDITITCQDRVFHEFPIWMIERGRKTGKLRQDCSAFPDGSLALAALAATLKGKSRLTGLRTLRVKETDRIAALANELRKVGCEIASGEDWIEITPPVMSQSKQTYAVPDDQREEGTDRRTVDVRSGSSSRWSSDPAFTVIETYNDHRMAMAFAVLGLAAPGGRRLAIRNPACVAKSYPTFWRDFAKLYQ